MAAGGAENMGVILAYAAPLFERLSTCRMHVGVAGAVFHRLAHRHHDVVGRGKDILAVLPAEALSEIADRWGGDGIGGLTQIKVGRQLGRRQAEDPARIAGADEAAHPDLKL